MARRSPFPPDDDDAADPGAMPAVRIKASTPQGKIGRLPHAIREEVNTRLLNNEPARSLLKWLNDLPDTITVCREYWGSEPVTAKNLSDWKNGRSYTEWMERRTRVEETKELMSYAESLASAGGKIAGGLSTVIASDLLAAFEQMRREGATVADLAAMVEPVAKLAGRENEAAKLAGQTADRELKKQRLQLDSAKLRKTAVEALRRLAMSPDVQAVLASKDVKEVQNQKLEQMIFGDLAASPF